MGKRAKLQKGNENIGNYQAARTIARFSYPELSCCKHPSTLKGEKQGRMSLY